MLEGYNFDKGDRLSVGWIEWLFTATKTNEEGIAGLHNQDYNHNRKKLVNPLDSPTRVMQLGSEVCLLKYIGLVYQKFTYDQHGLKLEDVKRIDRQNWASAQLLSSEKCRNCLKMLQEVDDLH